MFIGVRRSSIFRGPLIYFLGAWVPAAAIAVTDVLTHGCGGTGLFRLVVLTSLNAAMIVPGIVAFHAARRRRRAGACAPQCLPSVLGVILSGAVTWVPLALAAVVYGMCIPGRHGPVLVLAAALTLPIMAGLLGGLLGVPAYYLGVLVANRTTCQPAFGRHALPGLAVGGLAGCAVLGLLALQIYLATTKLSGGALLIALFPFMFLIGILCACVGALGFLGWDVAHGRRRLPMLAGALFIAVVAATYIYVSGAV